jgi:hypothetical protein
MRFAFPSSAENVTVPLTARFGARNVHANYVRTERTVGREAYQVVRRQSVR